MKAKSNILIISDMCGYGKVSAYQLQAQKIHNQRVWCPSKPRILWGNTLYELLPAFIFATVVIIVVSLATGKPSQEVMDKFEEVKNMSK